MTIEVSIPSVGESINEGVLARWLVADGDWVEEGSPIYELETDKISTEVNAEESGVLHHKVPEGETVEVGGTVAEIDTDAERPSEDSEKGSKKDSKEDGGAGDEKRQEQRSEKNKAESDESDDEDHDDGDGEQPRPGPAARRLIEEHGIDASKISGSGKDGRPTKQDVLAYLDQGDDGSEQKPSEDGQSETDEQRDTSDDAPPSDALRQERPAATDEGDSERRPMSPIRKRIAARLLQAQQNAAILSTFNEIDMSACMALRQRFKADFEETHGHKLGFMSFFTKACCQALLDHPAVNSQIDGDDIVSYKHVSVGIAVGSKRGLVVPVLRNAERLSFADIESRVRDYAEKAEKGDLAIDDMQGGTFTITNGGIYGSLLSTPILNPPQSGILGMHAIQKRPVAIDDEVVIRPMMYVALSYDHRIVDGAEAVSFLVRIKELIEAPERLLLGL